MSLRFSLFTWVQPILLAVAWLLLLLVSITPIPKSIYFLQIAADVSSSFLKSGVSGSVRFGVWGYCTSGLDTSYVSVSNSIRHMRSFHYPVISRILGFSHDTSGGCSPRHLGYQIDPSVAKALHVDDLTDAISDTLSAALVLHVIGMSMVAPFTVLRLPFICLVCRLRPCLPCLVHLPPSSHPRACQQRSRCCQRCPSELGLRRCKEPGVVHHSVGVHL